MTNVFVIGSKGIPANYGGFESFVDNLVGRKKSSDIQYHVSCLADEEGEFYYNGARCFNIKTPKVGSAKAVIYDIYALKNCIEYIEKNNIKNAQIYILACRIGPFLKFFKGKFEKNNIFVHVNPDGHEWKRSKWGYLIKKYWKLSERLMIKNSDNIICDSIAIEEYIKEDYKNYNPNTVYISYGAEVKNETYEESTIEKYNEWMGKRGVKAKEYFLIVGRFVPENNYELMIREFMKSNINKDLVIICNVEKNKFYNQLEVNTSFHKDKRIKFVGTVYDQKMLSLIRKNAFAYIHGHEVGGTNPSLLESLAITDLNILLDVEFNKEVGGNGAIYFTKEDLSLKSRIEKCNILSVDDIKQMSSNAKDIINNKYSWSKIIDRYEEIFLKIK